MYTKESVKKGFEKKMEQYLEVYTRSAEILWRCKM